MVRTGAAAAAITAAADAAADAAAAVTAAFSFCLLKPYDHMNRKYAERAVHQRGLFYPNHMSKKYALHNQVGDESGG